MSTQANEPNFVEVETVLNHIRAKLMAKANRHGMGIHTYYIYNNNMRRNHPTLYGYVSDYINDILKDTYFSDTKDRISFGMYVQSMLEMAKHLETCSDKLNSLKPLSELYERSTQYKIQALFPNPSKTKGEQ